MVNCTYFSVAVIKSVDWRDFVKDWLKLSRLCTTHAFAIDLEFLGVKPISLACVWHPYMAAKEIILPVFFDNNSSTIRQSRSMHS